MSDPQLYTGAYAFMDGKLLSQEVSLTIDKKSGSNPIFTSVLGYAGEALGAPMMEFTIESAAPSADFEVNPDPYMKTMRMAEMGFVMSGRQMAFKAFITDATYTHAVNQESKIVIKGRAPMTEWE